MSLSTINGPSVNNDTVNKTIVFRVDANSCIGTGHLMRCIALAQAANKLHIKIAFLLDAITYSLTKDISSFQFEVYLLKESLAIEVQLMQAIAYFQPDLLILDGYQYSNCYRAQVKACLDSEQIPFAIIDDNGGERESDLIHADIIINPTCMTDYKPDYAQVAPLAKVFAGEEYRLLRTEFAEQNIPSFSQRSGIVVTMGGSDPLNYSKACLTVLSNLEVKLPVTILIGAGFKQRAELIEQVNQLPDNFTFLYKAQNLASIFAQAQFVISAAGGTQFELYAMQSPAILLVSFDNQWRNSQAAKMQGWAEVLDFRQKFDQQALSKSILTLVDDKIRASMQYKMENSCASGAQNLIKAIFRN